MNLGEIRYLVDSWTNDSYEFKCQAFTHPHSYRGYYHELAFEPSNDPLTVADVTKCVCEAYTETFTGWKGGEYDYDDSTPVHLSFEGESSDEEGSDFTELLFAMDREYRSFNSNMCYNKPMETNKVTKMTTKRKTAAEKREEQAKLRAQLQADVLSEFVSTYQTRVLTLLHKSMYLDFKALAVAGDNPGFDVQINSRYSNVFLPIAIASDLSEQELLNAMEDLSAAESYSNYVYEERERNRLALQKKEAALAKLTKEERELLGV